MAVDVITSETINRSRDFVADYASDPGNAPLWYVNIKEVRWRTDPPVRVGSQVDFVARFLGRTLEYTYEIVELVLGERMVMRTAQGPFPMETIYEWRDGEPGSTVMTLRNRGRPTGFSSLLAPLMVPAMRSANRKDLARLKSILEARRG